MEDAKILLKIKDPEIDGAFKWVHLCYADESIYAEYLAIQDRDSCINPTLSRWIQEDYGVELPMESLEDIAALKQLVKADCKEKYPEIFRDSPTDRQGWLRLWVNKHMQEEVTNAGRE